MAFCCINASKLQHTYLLFEYKEADGRRVLRWAQFESVAFTQLSVPQQDLGFPIAGWSGRYGSLCWWIACTSHLNRHPHRHTKDRGCYYRDRCCHSSGYVSGKCTSSPRSVSAWRCCDCYNPGTRTEAIGAASLAFQWSYVHGLKIVAPSSLSFGIVGLLCIFYCNDITPKMMNKVECFWRTMSMWIRSSSLSKSDVWMVAGVAYHMRSW